MYDIISITSTSFLRISSLHTDTSCADFFVVSVNEGDDSGASTRHHNLHSKHAFLSKMSSSRISNLPNHQQYECDLVTERSLRLILLRYDDELISSSSSHNSKLILCDTNSRLIGIELLRQERESTTKCKLPFITFVSIITIFI